MLYGGIVADAPMGAVVAFDHGGAVLGLLHDLRVVDPVELGYGHGVLKQIGLLLSELILAMILTQRSVP